MWRNYVICVLLGLLIAVSATSLNLLRQDMTAQSEADRLRQRAVAAEATRSGLQQQVDQLQGTRPAAATPIAQAVTTVPGSPRSTPVAAPVPTVLVTSPDSPILQQIEADVATLRGLQPKASVPVR